MRDFLKIYSPFILLAVIGLFVAFRFVDPAPPTSIKLAAGAPGGAYDAFSQRYKRLMERHGLEVQLIATAGGTDNLRLIRDGDADAGLVQGGIALSGDGELVRSLGGMFKEPLWVFVAADSAIDSFAQLKTARMAIGPVGSGTRSLLLGLREEWGGGWTVSSGDLRGGQAAADALLSGDLDAAAFVASIEAPYVQRLLISDAVRLLPFERAEGLSRRNAALAPTKLLRGVLNIGEDLPVEDVPLIAPVAQIMVSEDLHPAIQSLLMDAAFAIHAEGTLLTPAGQFPDRSFTETPLSAEAARYYDRGPSALRQFFSYGVANFFDRAWVLAIPLLTLLVPVVRAAPPVYRWRVRRRIYVWYDDLRALETRGRHAKSDSERDLVARQLNELQEEVGRVDVPLSYTDDLYRLRSHIQLVESLVRHLSRDGRNGENVDEDDRSPVIV
ncbi:MAG: TAXI family TRAP transporter solute-binding subunit [Pseudomonadota bacterium]